MVIAIKEELESELEKQLDLLRDLSDDDGDGIKEVLDEIHFIILDGFDFVEELEDDEE